MQSQIESELENTRKEKRRVSTNETRRSALDTTCCLLDKKKNDSSNNNEDIESLSLRTSSTMYRRSVAFRASLDLLMGAKLAQMEKEIDRLPFDMKNAYMMALEQEIKQQSTYVRNRKLLLLFLRREDDNVAQAAVRIAKFFQHKLELFGVEKLPRRIVLQDLNEQDQRVLLSGFMCTNCGTDLNGSRIMLVRRDCLRSAGMLDEAYATSIRRVVFYQCMHLVENHDLSHTRDVGVVFWDLNSSLPLKIFRASFIRVIRMGMTALPFKPAMFHFCYNTVLDRIVVKWRKAMLQSTVGNNTESKIVTHDGSPWECICELSHFGIEYEKLPISEQGMYQVGDAVHKINEQLLAATPGEPEEPPAQCVETKKGKVFAIIENDIDDDSRNSAPKGNEQIHSPDQNSLENKIIDGTGAPDEPGEQRSGNGRRNTSEMNEGVCITQDDTIDTSLEGGNNTLQHSIDNNISNAVEVTFPTRLMSIIEKTTSNSSIWWTSNGTTIQIDKNHFTRCIIPNYFQGIQFSSFVRSLKRWGFERVPHKKGMIYAHPFFKEHSYELLKLMGKNATPGVQKEKIDEDSFPAKLMRLLKNGAHNNYIWFSADGTSFVIDKKHFTQKVLKEVFKGIQFSSFMRSLKRWKFTRVASAEETDADIIVYRHPLFQRDTPLLLHDLISGKTAKKEVELNLKSVHEKKQFLSALMLLLEKEAYSSVACWLPSGKVFQLHLEAFARTALSTEFGEMELEFFFGSLMQLNFVQLQSPEFISSHFTFFHHPLFQNKARHLLEELVQPCLPTETAYTTTTEQQPCTTINPNTLPRKVRQILQNKENSPDIWWLSNGNAFAIKISNYPQSALAQEFIGIRFESFIRSLRRWGFRRKRGYSNQIAVYEHPKFKEDAPHLLDNWTK